MWPLKRAHLSHGAVCICQSPMMTLWIRNPSPYNWPFVRRNQHSLVDPLTIAHLCKALLFSLRLSNWRTCQTTFSSQWLRHLGIHVISLWQHHFIVYRRANAEIINVRALLLISNMTCLWHWDHYFDNLVFIYFISWLYSTPTHVLICLVCQGDKCNAKCKTSVVINDLHCFYLNNNDAYNSWGLCSSQK